MWSTGIQLRSPYSITLKKAALAVYEAKKKLRMISIGHLDSGNGALDQANDNHKEALLRFKSVQGEAAPLRRTFLSTLATKRASQWNMASSNALKIIDQTERIRDTHQRARKWFKLRHPALCTLLVPSLITGHTNNMYNISTYNRLSDPKDIFDVLLRQNYRHPDNLNTRCSPMVQCSKSAVGTQKMTGSINSYTECWRQLLWAKTTRRFHEKQRLS